MDDTVNFELAFERHLRSRVEDWQSSFLTNRKEWDDFLNGTFGVLWTITQESAAVALDTPQRVKYLRMRADNGSADGKDEYYELLAKVFLEDGQPRKALACQRLRRRIVPYRTTSEYWRERHTAEINDEIGKIVDPMKPLEIQ
ncbi:hypothetical protein BZM27_06260 [Paraburkholderia steynii]|uniref:Uncharacterized protein n=1 Tax=Paraburkholderia steynii TaxID=1245441 RepID=A0A4R0XFI3_9BURK|nr:hypothetical protein BZM27_06260 [Paraburkholderia steynii]